jgi:hypothetical protein
MIGGGKTHPNLSTPNPHFRTIMEYALFSNCFDPGLFTSKIGNQSLFIGIPAFILDVQAAAA